MAVIKGGRLEGLFDVAANGGDMAGGEAVMVAMAAIKVVAEDGGPRSESLQRRSRGSWVFGCWERVCSHEPVDLET